MVQLYVSLDVWRFPFAPMCQYKVVILQSWFLLLLFLYFKKHLCCFTIISFLNFLQSSAKLLVQICNIQHAFTPFCVPRVTGSCCYEVRLIDCCSVALSKANIVDKQLKYDQFLKKNIVSRLVDLEKPLVWSACLAFYGLARKRS